jgi:hypothetical protein
MIIIARGRSFSQIDSITKKIPHTNGAWARCDDSSSRTVLQTAADLPKHPLLHRESETTINYYYDHFRCFDLSPACC